MTTPATTTDPQPSEAPVADNRGMAYREGNLHVYRGSSTGACLTALVASLLGYEEYRYEKTQTMLDNAAEQGNLHEPFVLEKLVAAGYQITQRQMVLEFEVIPGAIVRAHTDALAESGPGVTGIALVEVKSMSKARYAKWMASGGDLASPDFAKYGWQAGTYWHGLELLLNKPVTELVYAVINRDSGELDIRVFNEPPVKWKKIKRKIVTAEMWVARDQLPICTEKGAEKFFCPFVMLHDEYQEGRDENDPLSDLTATVVAGLAERHFALGEIIKAGKTAEEERKPISKALLKHVPKGAKVVAGGYRVTSTGGSYPKTDWDAIAEAANMTVSKAKEKFTRKESYEYPLVKRIEEKS